VARWMPTEQNDDTITGHEMLGLPRGVPQRTAVSAFQAECGGFETRLPLQIPFRARGDTQRCGWAVARLAAKTPQRSSCNAPDAQPDVACSSVTRSRNQPG
jgi:hypothetical protein